MASLSAGPREGRGLTRCTRCIMDTTVPDITFDAAGVCNYCHHYEARAARDLHLDPAGRETLLRVVERMRQEGRGHDYDCVLGVSGGLDSTMALYEIRQFGLRPLAIHLDNGWNTELSVSNIERLVRGLGVELYTHVLDWEEFRDLQLGFLRASIPNAEIPTDHAIIALLFNLAARHGIRYIVSGSNVVSEAIMPDVWMSDSKDLRLIKAVHRRFCTRPLRTYPTLSLRRWARYTFLRGVKYFPVLNYVPYVKADARALMAERFGWKDYGGKHYESIYTRFFQGYILPRKFGIDKRIAHYSTLINSGQMTREAALADMANPPYPEAQMMEDRVYLIKKLAIDEAEWEAIMAAPPKSHLDYPNSEAIYRRLAPVAQFSKRFLTAR